MKEIIEKENQSSSPRLSPMTAFLAIGVFIFVIIFGEFIIADLNAWLNPYTYSLRLTDAQMMTYELYRSISHAIFIIPFILLSAVFHFWIKKNEKRRLFHVISGVYSAAAVWFFARLFLTTLAFIFETNSHIPQYVFLFSIIALSTWAMIFFQKRANR